MQKLRRTQIMTKISIASSLILCALQPAYAVECSAKSGAATVPLLELYTSEGCSSCPPADKWLSGLNHDPAKFTPLAFHVDYWDYIGWKDKFSKAEYSDRQRKIASFNSAGFVYTPQFVMNGRDFKGWDNSRLKEKVESSQKLASRANLTLATEKQANGEVVLKTSVQSAKPNDDLHADIFVAIYENNLVSKINAGENSGRELKHDYVVREMFGAYQLSNQNNFSKNFNLNSALVKRGNEFKNMGAVIFVQNSQNGEIIQSLSLPFCTN